MLLCKAARGDKPAGNAYNTADNVTALCEFHTEPDGLYYPLGCEGCNAVTPDTVSGGVGLAEHIASCYSTLL
jgi:hypothetical protein